MTAVDISGWEMHNITKRGGSLRTRTGLVSIKTPSISVEYVGGFSVESPQTTEVWHYLFEQDAASVCTLRVFTEEFAELFTYVLGVIGKNPVITWGVTNNLGIISSPSFSGPLFFVVGGGVTAMAKSASQNIDTTALNIPRGHCAVFGDRFVVFQGPVAYFNDPGVDPRTFTAQNAVSLPGTIFDAFQAGDGALLFFTSVGVFSLPADSLGQGQAVVGFISKIPGLETTRPRNAAASNGRVAVLQKDGVITIDGARLVVGGGSGRRYFSQSVDVDDFRSVAEIYGTNTGFVVACRGNRGWYIDINLDEKHASFVTNTSTDLNAVGTLRSRDGQTLIILSNRVAMPIGNIDFGGGFKGVARGALDVSESQSLTVRRVTLSAANAGESTSVSTNGTTRTGTTPTKTGDVVIGTTLWSVSTSLAGKSTRTVRHSLKVRATDPSVEAVFEGGDCRIERGIDIEFVGQGTSRRDQG